MIGVSPAYFISRFTDRFTTQDIVTALPDIKAMGYDGFEPEIFHIDTLPSWKNGGAANVRDTARDVGLTPTQFVAHFLLKGFDTPTSLASPFGLVEMQKVLEVIDVFEDISVVVVPFSAFKDSTSAPQGRRNHQQRMIEKLGTLLDSVEATGRKMALEIMPNALIDGFAGFKTVCEQLESDTLGINLDTGHAHANAEDLKSIATTLGHRILGTHLCDNFGVENLSLAPGRADIDFDGILRSLKETGYTGSLDVEIICNPAEVKREYLAGIQHLQGIIQDN